MKVLITGGAGFIGSHIAEACLALGHEVMVVDDLSSGKPGNLPGEIPLRVADITDAGAMENIFNDFGPEAVSHHAAQINVRRSVEDPLFDARVNISGLISLAELSIRHKVKRFIFSSSGGAAYGEQSQFPAPEDHPAYPLSPYGVSKLAGERYLHYYRKEWGLNCSILRYSNVYGPRQDPHGEAGVVAIFSTMILNGEQPLINGDGLQTRDYIYVDDVVSANITVLKDEVDGVFNVGTGKETTVNELFHKLRDVSGKTVEEVHGPAMRGEQKRSSIDPSLLGRRSGWAPGVDLDEGLKRTFLYFQER